MTEISERLDGQYTCIIKQEDGEVGCGSSDAMSVYHKGEGRYNCHCFSCGLSSKGYMNEEQVQELTQGGSKSFAKKKGKKTLMSGVEVIEGVQKIEKGQYRYIADRGIKKDVCEFYGVKTLADKDTGVIKKHLYGYYNAKSELIATKARIVESKDFVWDGEAKGALLFGQQLFKPGGKFLLVTEGELDALAAYQMQGEKWPCVSIPNGAAAVKNLVKNNEHIYKFLDSFETIVLNFDNDEKGKAGAQVLAEIFPHKTKIMQLDIGFKDACDYLRQEETVKFVDCFWRAQTYTPASIVLSSSLMDAVMSGEVVKDTVDFPYSKTDDMIFGIRQGELITITAGSGVGKSAFVREIAMHIWKKTKSNIGVLMLEENNEKTAMGLVGIHMNKPLLLLDLDKQRPEEKKLLKHITCSEESRQEATTKVLGSDRFVLYNHFGSNDIDVIVAKVKQMIKIYNCKYVFLDHISIVVSGNEGDERRSIDIVMSRLRMLVEETKVSLFLVSHLKRPQGSKGHEEGGHVALSDLRGSAGIAQLSDVVLGLERNQQHASEFMRNVTLVRVLKCRMTGILGPSSFLMYDKDTARLVEIDEDEVEQHLEESKKDKVFDSVKLDGSFDDLS